MEIKCVIVELKPDSLNRVREWARYILENKSEALQSLENEGVTVESYFLFTLEKKDLLVVYMRGESFEKASGIVKNHC